jgi:hypothetical protein
MGGMTVTHIQLPVNQVVVAVANNKLVHVVRYNGSEFIEKEPYVPLSDLLKLADRLTHVLRGGEDYDGCWEDLEQILGQYDYGIDLDGYVCPKEEL